MKCRSGARTGTPQGASKCASGEAVERILRQDLADPVLVFDLAAVRGQVIEAP
jgi:hypothetical protein